MTVYARLVYLLFLGTFAYSIWFVGHAIDYGAVESLPRSILTNAGLLALFAIQHSGMARRVFKRAWRAVVPEEVERSTYVLATCVVLALLFRYWRPLADPVWTATHPALRALLWSLFALGWIIVIVSTCLIDHRHLFGLRQAADPGSPPPAFQTPALYRLVRHPIYFGFVVAFWSTPEMTLGHLLFAAAATLYILLGIQLEERDLIAAYGRAYQEYIHRTSMLIPWPRKADTPPLATPSEPSATRSDRR